MPHQPALLQFGIAVYFAWFAAAQVEHGPASLEVGADGHVAKSTHPRVSRDRGTRSSRVVRRELSLATNIQDKLNSMQAYYINLDNSSYRRQRMEDNLAKASLLARRFPAVSSRQISSGMFDQKYVLAQGLDKARLEKFRRDGILDVALNTTVACFISHTELLERASHTLKPEQMLLVMEDDVAIPLHWRQELGRVLSTAPSDWALLKISGWGAMRERDRVAREGASAAFYLLSGPFSDGDEFYYGGSAAYLVRGSTVKQVLAHLQNRPITDYDEMLLPTNYSTLRAYEVYPHPFDLAARALVSDIRPNTLSQHGRWLFNKMKSLSKCIAEVMSSFAR